MPSYLNHKDVKWEYCELTQDGEFSDRVYGMFARLADVRNYRKVPSLPKRGFPNDVCNNTLYAYCISVMPDKDYESDEDYYSEHRRTKSSYADEWIRDGCSVVMGTDYMGNRLISDPDWHTPSWCTTEEMKQCIQDCFYTEEEGWHGDYIEWFGLLGAMEGYEREGLYECRAVFWFDN